MATAGYIGYTGASSTAVSVITDIAESLDISGLVDVSGTSLDNILTKVTLSNTALDTIAANVLATSAVSIGGSVTAAVAFPVNQNVSGISLDAIETATEAIQVDAAAIEVLLTNANTDHAANEVLLTSIDADTNAIKVDTAANEVLLTAIDTVLDNIKVDTEAIETATEAIQVDAAAIEVLLTNANTDHAANEVLLTAIDTVLDTIKVDTEAIETAVEGVLDVTVRPSTSSYLSHVYLDLDAAGDNPTSNTEVIAAGGADTKLVIYGVQGSIVAAAASDYGNWFLSDGNTAAATTLWTGRAQGTTNTQFELTFPYGVALTANTALKVTSTEGSGNIFINAVIYYRTEAT